MELIIVPQDPFVEALARLEARHTEWYADQNRRLTGDEARALEADKQQVIKTLWQRFRLGELSLLPQSSQSYLYLQRPAYASADLDVTRLKFADVFTRLQRLYQQLQPTSYEEKTEVASLLYAFAWHVDMLYTLFGPQQQRHFSEAETDVIVGKLEQRFTGVLHVVNERQTHNLARSETASLFQLHNRLLTCFLCPASLVLARRRASPAVGKSELALLCYVPQVTEAEGDGALLFTTRPREAVRLDKLRRIVDRYRPSKALAVEQISVATVNAELQFNHALVFYIIDQLCRLHERALESPTAHSRDAPLLRALDTVTAWCVFLDQTTLVLAHHHLLRRDYYDFFLLDDAEKKTRLFVLLDDEKETALERGTVREEPSALSSSLAQLVRLLDRDTFISESIIIDVVRYLFPPPPPPAPPSGTEETNTTLPPPVVVFDPYVWQNTLHRRPPVAPVPGPLYRAAVDQAHGHYVALIPVHQEDHWSLLIVATQSRTAIYFSSLRTDDYDRTTVARYVSQALPGFRLRRHPVRAALEQATDFDCALFVLSVMHYIVQHGLPAFETDEPPARKTLERRDVLELLLAAIARHVTPVRLANYLAEQLDGLVANRFAPLTTLDTLLVLRDLLGRYDTQIGGKARSDLVYVCYTLLEDRVNWNREQARTRLDQVVRQSEEEEEAARRRLFRVRDPVDELVAHFLYDGEGCLVDRMLQRETVDTLVERLYTRQVVLTRRVKETLRALLPLHEGSGGDDAERKTVQSMPTEREVRAALERYRQYRA